MTPDLLQEGLRGSAPSKSTGLRKSRLKVTFVVGSLRDGGSERHFLELLRHLDRDRFEPSLILLEDAHQERSRGLVEHCFVLGIPQSGNSQWFLRAPKLAITIMRVQRLMKHLGSDIVHTFLPGPSIVGGTAARLARIRLIIGNRGSLPSQYRAGRRMAGWADTAAFHLAHFNLGNSHAVAREMIHLAGCPPRKCGTIHNGVDLRRFRPDVSSFIRQQLGWTQDEVVFGQLANFRLGKRHQDLIEMAAVLAHAYPQARFLLAGADYGAKSSIQRRIHDLRLDARVKVLGGTSTPETIFAALDVYVCTSEAEGFSNVVLEAMACAKPVIATNVGGNPEAVQHNHSGLLVPPADVAALTQGAQTLLADRQLRITMGNNGRRLAESRFSLETMVKGHQDLYATLFEQRTRNLG